MERRHDLVRIDDTGVVRPVDKSASERLRATKGTFRVVQTPSTVVLLERVGETEPSRKLRLSGEIAAPGMLCDVLSLIATAGWRGELVVLTHDASRSIFVEGGHVVGALSTSGGERIGDVMYRLGALDREQILTVAKRTTAERRFGETAVDLGFIPRERLFDIVRTQTDEIVFAALRLDAGTFWFFDGFDVARLAYHYRESAQALLFEGVRRMDEARYFRERVPSAAHVPVRLSRRSDAPPEIRAVLDACDGKRTVLDVARACALSEFEAIRALFQLVQGGFAQMSPPVPTSPEAIVEIFNGAIRPIVAAARPEMRARLAAFASTVGVYDALFLGAGPHEDGTLDARRVAHNVLSLGGDEPVAMLTEALYEYASFALFDATSEMPKAQARELTAAVSEHMKLLSPPSAPPSLRPPTSTRPAPFSRRRSGPQAPAPPPAQLPALQPLPTPPPETRASIPDGRPPDRSLAQTQVAFGAAPLPNVLRPPPPAPQPPASSPPRPSPPPPPRPAYLTPAPEPAAPDPALLSTFAAPGPTASTFSSPSNAAPFASPEASPPAFAAQGAPSPSGAPQNVTPLFAPSFAPTPSPLAPAIAARSPQPGSPRRVLRTLLLVLAILLLLGAGAASLVMFGVVRIPGLDLGTDSAAKNAPSGKVASNATSTDDDDDPAPAKSAAAAKSAEPTTPPEKSAAPATSAAPDKSAAPEAPASGAAPDKSAAPEKPAAPASGAAPDKSTTEDLPANKGRIVTAKAPAGFRVFVDGLVVGSTPQSFVVACGTRTVKVGSAGAPQTVNVPCGGEIEVGPK